DICSADYAGRNATIAANCLAAGVPADYLQLTNSSTPGYGVQTRFPFTLGGNPLAGPEESKSKTLGIVYSPSYVEGLDISLDWWSIDIENALATPTASEILNGCYALGNANYCDMLVRDTAPGVNQGVITDMFLVPQNVALVEAEGWDLNVRYRMAETSVGQFVFGFDGAYLSKWDQQANPLVDTKNYVGLYEEWNPTWRLRANASLDWTYGDFGASWMT